MGHYGGKGLLFKNPVLSHQYPFSLYSIDPSLLIQFKLPMQSLCKAICCHLNVNQFYLISVLCSISFSRIPRFHFFWKSTWVGEPDKVSLCQIHLEFCVTSLPCTLMSPSQLDTRNSNSNSNMNLNSNLYFVTRLASPGCVPGSRQGGGRPLLSEPPSPSMHLNHSTTPGPKTVSTV